MGMVVRQRRDARCTQLFDAKAESQWNVHFLPSDHANSTWLITGALLRSALAQVRQFGVNFDYFEPYRALEPLIFQYPCRPRGM